MRVRTPKGRGASESAYLRAMAPTTNEELPPLAAGAHWHRDGWTGAVLTAERVISMPADEQEHTIRQALDRAVAACRELLGA